MDKIRVVIADDHEMLREGLRSLLAEQGDISVVGEAADGASAIERVAELRPDVVLLDYAMPEMDGLEALPHIREKSPDTRVLILSASFDEGLFIRAVAAGARGYILKTARGGELAKAIRSVHRGEIWAERKLLTKVLEDFIRLTFGKNP